jgi:hypothetical protein
MLRELQFQHHDRYNDCDDTIAEGFKSTWTDVASCHRHQLASRRFACETINALAAGELDLALGRLRASGTHQRQDALDAVCYVERTLGRLDAERALTK